MKKVLFFIVLLVSCVSAGAQHYQLIEVFNLAASEGGFGIYSDIDPTGSKDMIFDMDAPNYSQRVQMLLPFSKLSSFLKSLYQAKEYFMKWREIAKNQEITHFSKDIPVVFGDQTMFFTSNDKWYRENGVDLKCRFLVDEGGNYYLVLDTDFMTSDQVVQHGVSYSSAYNAGSGRWSTAWARSKTTVTHYCPGASLFFSSEQEVDSFASKLNMVKQWKEGNIAAGKLFK